MIEGTKWKFYNAAQHTRASGIEGQTKLPEHVSNYCVWTKIQYSSQTLINVLAIALERSYIIVQWIGFANCKNTPTIKTGGAVDENMGKIKKEKAESRGRVDDAVFREDRSAKLSRRKRGERATHSLSYRSFMTGSDSASPLPRPSFLHDSFRQRQSTNLPKIGSNRLPFPFQFFRHERVETHR